MLWDEVVGFVRASLPRAPARVLEVGAGDGSLAAVLRAAGWDVVAIDPAGGGGADGAGAVRQVALADVDEPGTSFDAAVAVVSLHHVEPLRESLVVLGRLVRPGGLVVVDEFDVERLGKAEAAWQLEKRRAAGHDGRWSPAELVHEMRSHLHSWDAIAATLGESFEVGEPVRGSYLHRWNLPPGLRAEEERLIASGDLAACGVRVVCRRPGGN
jgi:SAM-dependent methyltransferase